METWYSLPISILLHDRCCIRKNAALILFFMKHEKTERPSPRNGMGLHIRPGQHRIQLIPLEATQYGKRRIILHKSRSVQQPRQELNAVIREPVPVQVVDDKSCFGGPLHVDQ